MQQVYIASSKPQYNSEVQVIQRQLNSIRSGLLHHLPIVREDGFYGVETARAIKAFQQTCNIKVDGILGPQTHACMMQKLREMPSIGAAPSRYTIGPVTSKYSIEPAPIQLKGSSLTSSIYSIIKSAADVFSAIAQNLQLASDQAAKQLANLHLKYQNGAKISQADIQNIMKSMWQKPSINKIREEVEREVMDKIRKMSLGNTNRINYKNDLRTITNMREIASAQRQLAKGPNTQTVSLINKTVAKRLVDKCAEELRSVQFDKRISQRIGKITKVPKGGGVVLTGITLIPLFIHFGELCYNLLTNNPIEQNVRDIAADLVELVVGTLIALAISALLAAIGITGGLAVLIVVIVGIIIGLLLSFCLDDKDITWSKKIVNWTYETYLNLSNSIHSKETFLIDFQRMDHLNYYA